MGSLIKVEVERLLRKLTPEELYKVTATFMNLVETRGANGHPLVPFVSFAELYRTFEAANGSGKLEAYALDDTVVGVLMYDTCTPFWTNVKMLQELLVLSLDDSFCGFGRIAVERLEQLAVENDCSIIAAGSALCVDHKPIENLYVRKGGYQLVYPNYVKVLN